jgi:hypothetical protein
MQPLMILFRFVHVVSGILWVGGVLTATMFILPAIRATGPAGGSVMRHLLLNTKFGGYFPSLGGLTVLSGLWMFWHDGNASNGAFYSSNQGITLSIGALGGIIALIVGGAVVGRSFGQIGKILKAIDAGGGQPTPEQGAQMAALRAKMATGSKIVVPALLIAATAMAIARYV